MKKLALAAGLFFLACTAIGHAWADPIQFNASGILSDGAAISGTLTVDPATGAIDAVNIHVGGPDSLTFTSVVSTQNQSYEGDAYELVYLGSGSIWLAFSISPSFTGFDGGSVNGGNIFYSSSYTYGPNIENLNFSAPVAPPPTVTPEPASWLLFATGLLGIAFIVHRRKQIASAVSSSSQAAVC